MSDLEMLQLCAAAMKFDPPPYPDSDGAHLGWHSGMSAGMDVFYNPLLSYKQAMALLLWLSERGTAILSESEFEYFTNHTEPAKRFLFYRQCADYDAILSAIVQCVAHLHQSKTEGGK